MDLPVIVVTCVVCRLVHCNVCATKHNVFINKVDIIFKVMNHWLTGNGNELYVVIIYILRPCLSENECYPFFP